MAGEVRTSVKVNGKRIRLCEAFDDRASFTAALDKVTGDAIRLRKSALAESKARRSGYRKNKAPKDA